MTILLIDDDETVLRTVGRFLDARGHTVRTTASASEALPLMEPHPPDLVVSDIQMPEMDGVAALKAIRERFPDLPVILMTGYATVETAVAALRLGAMDYLKKPICLAELQTCIRRVEARDRKNV